MHLPLLQIILFLVPLQICETQASSPANPASNPKLEDHYHTHHPWTWALPPSPTPAVTTQEISTLTISSLSISTVTVSEIQIETFTASSDDSGQQTRRQSGSLMTVWMTETVTSGVSTQISQLESATSSALSPASFPSSSTLPAIPTTLSTSSTNSSLSPTASNPTPTNPTTPSNPTTQQAPITHLAAKPVIGITAAAVIGVIGIGYYALHNRWRGWVLKA